MSKKLWFDIVNSSHAQFFRPFVEEFNSVNELVITTRDLAETNTLVNDYGVAYRCFGQHWGKNKSMKIMGYLSRSLKMMWCVRGFDYAFTHGSVSPIALKKCYLSKLISFYDNEYADSFSMLGKHSDHFFVPSILEKEAEKVKGKSTILHTFQGFKEQIYLADFEPDKKEIASIPFDSYLVVRPEAWKSDYVNVDKILAYDLTKELVENGHQVVFLSRYGKYPSWMKKEKDIYVPPKAVDGKQLSWFSHGVLTGSGTLAREAGVLGVPSVSFYPCDPLKVDIWMEKNGYIHRSRDIRDILNYLNNAERDTGLLKEAEKVSKDFFKSVGEIIQR